ncbi:hypothetical protein GCM10022271_08710 [Corallibacter vietnamensis]|uniref:PKD domain-containing protein n=1 Tax=Corallibacter vietnamensis TaxID=904130 RepID=A0ABP7H0Q0_9FLAO
MKKNYSKSVFESENVFLVLFVVLFNFVLFAQKPQAKKGFEISLEHDEVFPTEIKKTGRYNASTGFPVALYGLNYEVPQGSPETMAQYYLGNEYETLGLEKKDLSNLRHHATRSTSSGTVVRYRQYSGDYPVNKNEITISISPKNKIVYVMNSYQKLKAFNQNPSISKDRAYEIANEYLNINSAVSYRNTHLTVYNNTKITKLAHEVVISATDPLGEWHVFVDAQTGEVFKVVDLNHYHTDKDKKKKKVNKSNSLDKSNEYRRRATGTGMVFNPDPLSSNGVAYGGGYVDGNDANTTELNNARFSVILNDITQTGSTYSLVGPRAEIVDFDAPSTGLFSQNSSDFSFTRQEQGFEPVNIYFHIDYLINYINNTLGCDVMPYQYSGGVRYDAHGAGGADNSYYTGGTGRLSFGEGCVDDGEDSDVIHHELGHGLHDWVTAGGLSQVDGLSEGCGDYVAQSYNRSLGNWNSTDPQYNWVFNWDGHNTCWGGRTTAHTATYPDGLVGQIHTDGQIWATCLMGIWDEIGQQEMDKIFYEGLGMTNGASSQNDAAVAVYQAAVNLNYSQSDINTIHSSLTDCGYTLPALPGPPVAALSVDNESICLDTNNIVVFSDNSVPDATSWSWSFEGGTPSSSTDQNPTVTYSSDGTYDVTLTVTNSFGTDTITLTDYISVVSGSNCVSCDSLCPSEGNTVYDTSTTLVVFNEINNASGKPSGYSDYTASISTDVNRESEYDLTVHLNTDGNWECFTRVWIDWNQNCVFDANEEYDLGSAQNVSNGATSNSPLTVTVPVNAVLGTTTMRVSTQYNAAPGPCEVTTGAGSSFDAEVEDYAVNVLGSLSVVENVFSGFSVYPNPNSGSFNVKMNAISSNNIDIKVYDIRGRRVFDNTYNASQDFNQTINLGDVQSGIYLLNVSDGQKTVVKKLIVN